MEEKTVYEVIIVGAGPAGLALGYHLKKTKINFIILEKGSQAGESWSRMPDHLHLISLWKSNLLVNSDTDLSPAYKAHSAKDFALYLSEFPDRYKLPVKCSFEANTITKVGEIFEIRCREQVLFAKFVVDCRGYFSYPWTPVYPIEGSAPRMLHFKDFKNAQSFSNDKVICIVGKRLSAGQVINELVASDPERKILVSTRSKLRFSPSMAILNFLLKHLNLFEWLPLRLKIKKSLDIPMHSSAKKHFKSNVKIVGDIISIKDCIVSFSSGESLKVDTIIFTTGFRRESIQLKDDFESLENPGMFYLGIEAQRTFTSRFLRGIKADAPILAKLILGRFASKNSCQ